MPEKMKIAYISVIRDDEDIFPWNIKYYYNIGIRNFYIMLHLPSKINLDIAENLQKTLLNSTFKININNQEKHHHDIDVKILTNAALKDGFTWLIGTDADEILILKKHESLSDFLKQFSSLLGSSVLCFKWVDRRANHNIYPPENPFIGMSYQCTKYMDETNQGWIKCSGQFNTEMQFITGFHNIIGCSNIIKIHPNQAYFAHFPERNLEQFEKKMNIQEKNWIERYGYFYGKGNTDYKKIWQSRIITADGNRQVAGQNKIDGILEYNYDPLSEELFR